MQSCSVSVHASRKEFEWIFYGTLVGMPQTTTKKNNPNNRYCRSLLLPRSVEQKSEESMLGKLPQGHFLLSYRHDHTSRIIYYVGKGLQTQVFRQLVELDNSKLFL